jgi:hypothetical protein
MLVHLLAPGLAEVGPVQVKVREPGMQQASSKVFQFFNFNLIILTYFRQDILMEPKLTWNSHSSCLSFPDTRITGMYHHAQLMYTSMLWISICGKRKG